MKTTRKVKQEPEPEVILRRRYSGTDSIDFWERVKRCPNREVYTLALILQEIESRVLSAVESNQPRTTNRRRR